jgi:hypothetical protein
VIAVNRRECGFSDQPRSRFRETHEEHEEKSAPVVFVIVVNAEGPSWSSHQEAVA